MAGIDYGGKYYSSVSTENDWSNEEHGNLLQVQVYMDKWYVLIINDKKTTQLDNKVAMHITNKAS